MTTIIPDQPRTARRLPAPALRDKAWSPRRLARLAALDPEQMPQALAFLSAYRPRVFDTVLDTIEPPVQPGAQAEAAGMEPFCLRCGAPLGVFLAHGPDYKHYRGVLTATSKPRPYKADHKPVIGWRPATDTTSLAQDQGRSPSA
jgi:hypothetical protein